MNNKLEITFKGDHILVIADGDKDYRFMDRLWRETAATCVKHDCFNVLGIANTSTPVEAVEGYDLANIFRELNIGQNYRIAWVELDDDARDLTEFMQTVLSNRGLPGLLFDTEAEAREWLLGVDS
jgi:hypothetical protein